MSLQGRNILIGITGGIACYKTCDLVSALRKSGATVDVVMTRNACEFIAPKTLEALSGRPVVVDMFEHPAQWEISHISLAQKADLCMIAPATANCIAKLACGIADDMLSTTVLALHAPLIVVPSMNTAMYEHPATQHNLQVLRERGVMVVEPDCGRLACGDTGKGKMPAPLELFAQIEKYFAAKNDYAGKRVLVTAGATREAVDGVRYLTNRSSGKMGIAIASAAAKRGAQVTLVAGICSQPMPQGVQVVPVTTTQEMYDAVLQRVADQDIVIKAAAPADYRPAHVSTDKIKSEHLTLELVKNPDIAKAVGEVKGDRKLVIFCAETRDLIASAHKKCHSKNADLVVANDVTREGAGFDVDTNIVTLVTPDGNATELPVMAKSELADVLLDRILTL